MQVCTLGVPVEASLEASCLGRQLVQDLGDQPLEKAAVQVRLSLATPAGQE